jgi:hypothetical protein
MSKGIVDLSGGPSPDDLAEVAILVCFACLIERSVSGVEKEDWEVSVGFVEVARQLRGEQRASLLGNANPLRFDVGYQCQYFTRTPISLCRRYLRHRVLRMYLGAQSPCPLSDKTATTFGTAEEPRSLSPV